jgi:hypothetical protein
MLRNVVNLSHHIPEQLNPQLPLLDYALSLARGALLYEFSDTSANEDNFF